MGALCAIVLVFGFFAVCQSTIRLRKYIAKPEMDDYKSDDELVGEHKSTSVRECAARCQTECSFYGFNPQMKKCRTHKKIFKSGMSNEGGWRYYTPDYILRDCKDIQTDGYFNTGVYEIYPYGTSTRPVTVFCDMTTMGGGWTAIQKRITGSLDFDRNWTEYKKGFGSPEQDVWVGNDIIHQFTKEETASLYVSITLGNGTTLYEMYDGFSVSDETDKYQLFLAGPATGTLGDSMLNTGYAGADLSGMYFSTPERDNDGSSKNCAALSNHRGGWWFNNCNWAFLNGQLYPTISYCKWCYTLEIGASIRETMMMIRRH